MAVYILRRFAQAFVVLAGVTFATFALLHLVPGDAATAILGRHATPTALAALRRNLGLDKSLPAQYAAYVIHTLELNFGHSTSQEVPVGSLLAPRLAVTLVLTAYATALSLLVAVPLAVISALRKNRLADHAIRLVTMAVFAMPAFWLALVLILIFAVNLRWFPSSGYSGGAYGHFVSLTLPAVVLACGVAPMILRTLRGGVIEALDSDFVEAARARGLGSARVLRRYVIRNAIGATITVIGVNIAYLLGGVVIVENVFALPGVGSLLVTAVSNRDLPLVQGITLALAALVVVVNLGVDLTYAAVDPRIRLGGRK